MLDVAAPRGSFVLRDGTRPGRADQRRRRRDARCWRCSTRSPGSASDAAGLVAARRPQPRRARLRRPRSTRSSPRCPTRHRARRLQPPGPADALGADYDVAGRLDLAALERARRPEGRRLLRLRTRRLHARDRRRAHGPRRRARARRAPRRSAPSPSTPRGSVKAGDRAPHAPDGAAGTGPDRHVRAQQPRRRRGTTASGTCSTSPRRATCRSASAAAPASATTARAALLAGAVDLRHRPARAAARRAGSCVCCTPPGVRAHARLVTG